MTSLLKNNKMQPIIKNAGSVDSYFDKPDRRKMMKRQSSFTRIINKLNEFKRRYLSREYEVAPCLKVEEEIILNREINKNALEDENSPVNINTILNNIRNYRTLRNNEEVYINIQATSKEKTDIIIMYNKCLTIILNIFAK